MEFYTKHAGFHTEILDFLLKSLDFIGGMYTGHTNRLVQMLDLYVSIFKTKSSFLIYQGHSTHSIDCRRFNRKSTENTIYVAIRPLHEPSPQASTFLMTQLLRRCAQPTLVELAGLPPVPTCKGNPEPSVHCLHGTSYASAFGVGSAQPRSFITHQWPYSMYASPLVPHTDDPAKGKGTMAYGIRNEKYRYIVNMEYSGKTYLPEWEHVVSEQLYDYDEDPHETTNRAVNKTYAPLLADLREQLRKELEEG